MEIHKQQQAQSPKEDLDFTIPCWRPNQGRVVIYPHIEIPVMWSYDQLLASVTDIQLNCDGLFIKIYEKNSYCSEVNGGWNVVFTFTSNKTNYTYMIRRDYDLKKTFACPFYNVEYGYIGDACFNKDNCPVEFDILERYILDKYGGKIINHFCTKLL